MTKAAFDKIAAGLEDAIAMTDTAETMSVDAMILRAGVVLDELTAAYDRAQMERLRDGPQTFVWSHVEDPTSFGPDLEWIKEEPE